MRRSRPALILRLWLAGLAVWLMEGHALAIEGGGPPRGDRLARATVAIGTLVRDADGDVSFSYCSGVLVRPDVVLTAAHCVAQDPLASVVFPYEGSRIGRDAHPVAALARSAMPSDIPGEFGAMTTTLSHDTALLRLAKPVRNRSPLRVGSSELARSQILRLAGGGQSGGRAGKLRVTDLVPVLATNGGLVVARAASALVCFGDSGGPVVVDGPGGPVLVGVASAVLTRNPPCGSLVVIAPARPQS